MQAYNSLNQESYRRYLRHYDIDIRDGEVKDLKSLIDNLSTQAESNSIFNGYYVGYKIPQIGKEFDLLRFGRECLINIELKSTCSKEKIEKQLIRNKYYLNCTRNSLYSFTFVSGTEKLYLLDDSLRIKEVDFSFLDNLINKQIVDYIEDSDELFNPSNYLVSPFNSTQKFLENEYFLTHQQEDIKSQILKYLNREKQCTFISVKGSAGTGKTLLVYDIVKNLRKESKKLLIVHCGSLNNGQYNLRKNGWEIIPIKEMENSDLSKYDVVIIDEAQRIYPEQFSIIVEKIVTTSGCCIFSYDKSQTLASWEEQRDIGSKISSIEGIVEYRLSEKIRTNKEISTFIKSLFNRKRNFELINKGNIELNYFENLEDAKGYLGSLNLLEWEILRFTPSRFNSEYHEKYSKFFSKPSHKVIGQEFDGVAVTIDKFFYYSESGELKYRNKSYYDPVKMLFQNITRTRKRLNLVIIGNEEILNRCVSILNDQAL